MRSAIFFFLALLISHFAFADDETAERISAKQPEISRSSGFHWITHKCTIEEAGEIETTPGSPPLNVDDPATPGCNKWEINVTVDGDVTREEKTWELPLLDLNYGVGDNLQLKYEVPNISLSNEEAKSNSIGDSKAGIKYQFYGNDESKLQSAIYPQVQFLTPGANPGTESSNNRGSIVTLPILVAKRIATTSHGDVMLTANLGYNISSKPHTANFASAAVGVGAPLLGKAAVYAELATEQAMGLVTDVRDQLVRADIGVAGPVGKHFGLYGAIGRSLIASDNQNHTYFVSGIHILPGD